VEQVAKTIGADLNTINDWLEVGAIGRVVFGGGQFSRYELDRAALVFELVKFGFSPSCARETSSERWNMTCNKFGQESQVISKHTR
jgi:hypothetical protein